MRRKRPATRALVAVLLLVALLLPTVGLAACGSAPCKTLLEKVCAATDEAGCKLYTDSVGGDTPTESQRKACQLVLDDEQTLGGVLELLDKRAHPAKSGGTNASSASP